MLAMNLNVLNTITISEMFVEGYIDVTGRIANFKIAFFVLAYIFVRATGAFCYFYTIRHLLSPFKNMKE